MLALFIFLVFVMELPLAVVFKERKQHEHKETAERRPWFFSTLSNWFVEPTEPFSVYPAHIIGTSF